MATPFGTDGKSTEEALLRMAEQAEDRSERYEHLVEQAEAITVTESSDLATVTIDVSGVVTELNLVENLRGITGGRVAADIMATIRRAQARLTERLAAVAASTVGPDDQVAAGMMNRLRDKFGEADGPSQPDQPPTRPAPSAQPRRPVVDNDDQGSESIMRRRR